MKKIFSSFVTVLALGAALVSCNREKDVETPEEAQYLYHFEIVDNQTKATLNEEGVWWVQDDGVGLFVGTGSSDKASRADVEGEGDTKAVVYSSNSSLAGKTVYPFYPYFYFEVSTASECHNKAGSTDATIIFSDSQKGADLSAMPMAGIPFEVTDGTAVNGKVYFWNLGSVLAFRVYSDTYQNETVKSITFQSADKTPVSGRAKFDLTKVDGEGVGAGAMKSSWFDSSNKATVTQSVPVAASKADANTPIYLVVAPGTFPAESTIEVVTDAAVYTFTFASGKTFERNGLYSYPLNLNKATRVEYTGSYGPYYVKVKDTSEPVVGGKYLFVYEDEGTARVFKPVLNDAKDGYKTTDNVVSASIKGGGTWIASSEEVDACMAVIERQNGTKMAFDIYTPGVGLSQDGLKYYFVPRKSSTNFVAMTGEGDYRPTFSVTSAGVFTLNRDTYYLTYSTSSVAFSMSNSNSSGRNLALFKLVEDEHPAAASRNLSFNVEGDAYSCPLNIAPAQPAYLLQGDKTDDVTFSSSNKDVADFNDAGQLELKAVGTTIITAHADAIPDEWQEGEASYTLTVTEEIAVSVYNKVTSTADLEVGAKYLIVYEGSSSAAVFKPILSGSYFTNKDASNALSATIANNTITSPDFENCQMTLEAGYYFLVESASRYLYPTYNNIGAEAEKSDSHNVTVSISNGVATISRVSSSSTFSLQYSSSDKYFQCTNSGSVNVALYMLYDGRQKQTLTVSGSEAEYDLGTKTWTVAVPSVSGNQTSPLAWSSSNEAVATVDDSGNITPVAKGTTTITATAPANETYKSGSVSFTVTVFNSNQPKYVKATEAVDGGKYLIVSGGYALKNNNSSTAGALAVEIVDGVITMEEEDLSSVLWTATESSGKFTFKNDTRSLYRTGTSSYSASLSTSNSASFSYNDDDEYLTTTISNSTYYLYYSSSFKYSKNQHNAALYELYDSRTPQEIAFTASTAVYDLYVHDWTEAVPTLQGAQGTVTYESSNTNVASVDETSGAITISSTATAGNKAVITAKAAGNTTYKPGEASYTITIVNSDPSLPEYKKVTSTDDLEAGAQYLLVFEGLANDEDDGDPKVFNPVLKSSDNTQFDKATTSAKDVMISNGIIKADCEDYQFTLEDGYYLLANKEGKYIVPTGSSSGSGTISAESPASTALSITFDNGIVQIKATSGTNYLVWSTSSHYFSSNATISGQYSTGICLYKLKDDRTPQEITFSAATAEYDVYTGNWTVAVPTLQNAQGTVTYSSSNTSVASVNETSGAVTIPSTAKAGDTAVITAKAAGNTTYKPGKASYTITIVSSAPPTTYTKVTSTADVEANAQYILVYETASKAFKPILNGSAFTKSTANAVDVAIANGVIQSSSLDDCLITFEEGKYLYVESAGKYLYPGASGNSALGAENKTEDHIVSITIDSEGIATIARSNDATYHLYWSNSNYFSGISNSGSQYAANICIYKKN